MRRRRRGLKPETFPFLAVLLCAMGSLILLLLVLDRRAKVVARVKALQALAQLEKERTGAQSKKLQLAAAQQAEWELRRLALRASLLVQNLAGHARTAVVNRQGEEAARKVRREHERIRELEEQIRAERDRLAAREKEAESRRHAADALAGANDKTRRELARMTAELEKLEKTLADLKKARRAAQQTYSVIPYNGKRGDTRRPIYVECTAEGLIFHPDRHTVRVSDDLPALDIRGEVERRIAHLRTIGIDPGGNPNARPYLLMLVRPAGILSYYRTVAALNGVALDFGYEFIESDWVLDFPPDHSIPAAQPWMMTERKGAGTGTGSLSGSGESKLPPSSPPAATLRGPFAGERQGGIHGPGGTGLGPGSGGIGSGPGLGGPYPPLGVERPGTTGGTGGTGLNPSPGVAGPPLTGGRPGEVGSEPASGDARSPSAGERPGGAGPKGTADIGPPPGGPLPGGNPPGLDGMKAPGEGRGAGPSFPGGGYPPSLAATAKPPTLIGEPRGSGEPQLPGEPPGLLPPLFPGQGTGAASPNAGAPSNAAEPNPPEGPDAQADGPPGEERRPAASEAGGASPNETESEEPGIPSVSPALPFGPRKPERPPVRLPRPTLNRDWVLSIECRADGVVLYPNRFQVPVAELRPGQKGGPALAQTLQQIIARRQATVRPGEPPYRPQLRFLVRPDGLRSFYLAYPALESLRLPMTRENLEPPAERKFGGFIR